MGARLKITLSAPSGVVSSFRDSNDVVVPGDAVDVGTWDVAIDLPADWSVGTERYVRHLNGAPEAEALSGEGVAGCDGCGSLLVVSSDPLANPAKMRSHLLSVGAQNPNVTVVAELYNDSDNDGVRDSSERNLSGWTAKLYDAAAYASNPSTAQVLATAVTGSNGRATFYVDPGTAGGTANTYTVEYTQPADADPNWSPTPATVDTPEEWGTSAVVSVIAGESVAAPKGFIRLGTLEVVVFHDIDGDRVNDDFDGDGSADEPRLAGRTVRLLSRNGQTVLATRVSNSAGTVAFKVAASTDYQVEIVIPAGWTQTTPLGSNGDPTTRMRVTTVADITQSTPGPDFGMWEVNDTTPPPNPTFAPGTGEVPAGSTIEISSESGSTIWYTTDGTDPNPATGVGTATPSPASVQVNSVDLRDEVQTVSVTADGGTFTLSLAGQTTGGIAWNADASGVKAALEALTNIVSVSVTGGTGGPWTVTFDDPGATNVAEMTANLGTLSLTVGAPTAKVVTTTQGGVTVRAVAVDGSGNQSGVAEAIYTLSGTGGTGETRTVSPTTWTVP